MELSVVRCQPIPDGATFAFRHQAAGRHKLGQAPLPSPPTELQPRAFKQRFNSNTIRMEGDGLNYGFQLFWRDLFWHDSPVSLWHDIVLRHLFKWRKIIIAPFKVARNRFFATNKVARKVEELARFGRALNINTKGASRKPVVSLLHVVISMSPNFSAVFAASRE
jgi:hypothetical protein